MADTDNLFGSDSDDDDDFMPKGRSAPEAAEMPQDDEPEEEAPVDEEPGPSQPADYNNDDGFREPERPIGPPMSVDAPAMRPLGIGDTRLVRLSNILNIETRPFDPATHQAQEAEVVIDDSGKKRVRLRDQNVIRWRVKEGDDGAPPALESNARFVRWSDGSLQLLVGDEALDCAELDMAGDHHFLFLRHVQAQLLEAQARFNRKLVFRPASLNSRFHKRLAQAVDRSHVKANRVRKFNAVADPAREKAEREKAEEARIRASEQLERRQNKEMRRYAPTPRPSEPRPRGSASGLTAQYLEAVEDAYETDEDDDPGLSATERARRNLQRRSAEDEREAEERLARAKRAAPQPSQRGPAPKRQAAEDSDFDLDDLSAEDDEENIGATRTQQRGRQRGLVLSDDDD